jgi:hypothetical protein
MVNNDVIKYHLSIMSSTTVNQEQPNINDTAAAENRHTSHSHNRRNRYSHSRSRNRRRNRYSRRRNRSRKTDKTEETTTTATATPATAPASNITPLSLFPPSYAYFENVFTFQTYIVFFIVITLILC